VWYYVATNATDEKGKVGGWFWGQNEKKLVQT